MMESVNGHLARAERRGRLIDNRDQIALQLRRNIRRHRADQRRNRREFISNIAICIAGVTVLAGIAYSFWGDTLSYIDAALAAAGFVTAAVSIVGYVRDDRALTRSLGELEQMIKDATS